MASATDVRCGGKAYNLPGVHRGRSRGPETLGAQGARAVFQSAAPGVRVPNHVEPLERIYLGIQRTRSDSTISRDGEPGEFSWRGAFGLMADSGPHKQCIRKPCAD